MLFVDDAHELIYCYIPKIACTNWKRTLLVLTGKLETKKPEQLNNTQVHHNLVPKYLRTGNSYEWSELEDRLARYYKFMFVREPLERLSPHTSVNLGARISTLISMRIMEGASCKNSEKTHPGILL